MPESLADRVGEFETNMGTKTIQEQFREQAELIDRRFSQEFSEQAQLIKALQRDVAILRNGVNILLKRSK